MSPASRLLMISAMYENGGNTMHRLLDGHERLLTYPFESQIGNRYNSSDFLASLFPFKYRWPEFPVAGTLPGDFELFFDEELKTRVRAPRSSKFRDAALDIDDAKRKELFVSIASDGERSTGNLVMAFFRATFEAWTNMKRTGNEDTYVGYSPIIGVDAERMMRDLSTLQVIHVVRNPYSALAETRHRPFPLSLERYTHTWCIVQHFALAAARANPDRFHIVRFEDVVRDLEGTMKDLSGRLHLPFEDTMVTPSFNSEPLTQIYPWGTIRSATPEYNRAKMEELSDAERKSVEAICGDLLKSLDYTDLSP